MNVRSFLRANPLLGVLFAAAAIRALAVVWSQGFIHSDDHFDTIAVAWDWLHGGLWGEDGYLRWKHQLSHTIGRFPLYTLFLWVEMKLCQWMGITSLSSIMYVIRASHALISLLPVWAAFRIVAVSSRSVRWAVVAGLVAAFHFAFPFLGVRNLIEVVGGSLWLVALWYLYRHLQEKKIRWLYLAGLMTGLAWMIRFQIAFAVLPVPFLLWWESRRIGAAVHYAAGVAMMLLLSGLTDWLLLGRFAGSTITNLTMNTGLDALYNTIPLLYPVLLLLLMVPPVSLVLPFLILRPGFIRNHRLIFWSSLSFVGFHSIQANQQERFIFPILFAFVVLAVLAVRQYLRDRRPLGDFPKWLKLTTGVSLLVNLVLLGFCTFAYGHKGMIEPLKWFEENAPEARVMFLQPEVKRWVPLEYAGQALRPVFIRKWEDLGRWPADRPPATTFDFFVVYPGREDGLRDYLDSLSCRFGPLEPVFQVRSSYFDQTLHRLNPRHNDNYAAFVFRPRSPGGPGAGS